MSGRAVLPEQRCSDEAARNDARVSLWTHAFGVLVSVLGGAALVLLAVIHGDAWDVVGVSVFVASLVTLYAASTAYHACRTDPLRQRLKVLDHCAIYVLIAGTYTPFTITALRGAWGWTLFGVIWGLAAAGVVFKLGFTGRFNLLSTTAYLLMGWLVLIAAVPLLRELAPVTLLWLLAGGIAYTAGTPFYHSTRIRYAHSIWHVFVLAGSAFHAVAVATVI